MNGNPVTPALKHIRKELRELQFSGANLFVSSITAVVLLFVLLIFVILWPYGVVAMIQGTLWQLVVTARNDMRGKGVLESMPYTTAMGIYFVVWLPFALVCLPFAAIGYMGKILFGEDKTAASHRRK